MITVTNVVKSFHNEQVLQGCSLKAENGRITTLLGPNGAGKTTLLRILLGLLRQDSGTALIDGNEYSSFREPLTHVGVALGGVMAHPSRTPRSHLGWIAASQGIPTARIEEVLQIVGLWKVRNKRIGAFSLGMNQRLSLATALLGNPQNIILDEPMNGLDIDGVFWMRDMISSLAKQGHCVLMTSHLLAEVQQVSGRVVAIGGGKTIFDEELDDLLHEGESLEQVYRQRVSHYGKYAMENQSSVVEER